MRLSEIFRLVWLNLSQNKFKVILTSIGIVVGCATIMMVIAIGTGGKMEVAEQFKNLNAGAIDISFEGGNRGSVGFGGRGDSSERGGGFSAPDMSNMPSMDYGGGMPNMDLGGEMPSMSFGGEGMPDFGGMFGDFGGGGRGDGGDDRMNQESVTLTDSDREDLEIFVPGVSDTTISYSTTTSVEGGELESASYYTIAGVQENYLEISNLTLAAGSFLSEENNDGKEKVCILGQSVATEIFGDAQSALEDEIYIDGRPYAVVGVL